MNEPINQTPPPEPHQDPRIKYLLWGIPPCLVMGVWQTLRALSGNTRSWAYVFEWPFFAIFIYYMYWKMKQPREDFSEDEENPLDN